MKEESPKTVMEQVAEKNMQPVKRPKRLIVCDDNIKIIKEAQENHAKARVKLNSEIQAIRCKIRRADYFEVAQKAMLRFTEAKQISIVAGINKNVNLVHIKSYVMRAEVFAKEALECAQKLQDDVIDGTVQADPKWEELRHQLKRAYENTLKCKVQASRYANGKAPNDMNLEI